MTPPRLSRLATEILAGEAETRVESSRADEIRTIRAIEEAIRSEARRRRLRLAAMVSAIAIAAALALFVGWRTRSQPATLAYERAAARAHVLADGVVVRHAGAQHTLEGGVVLEPSDHLVTRPSGRASIALGSGTTLVIEGSSDLAIVEQGTTLAFALKAGAVRADVAKLRSGERFLVRTLDAEIEVRGTSFSVDVVAPSPSCGGGTRTRVAVTEGVVVVRGAHGEAQLRAGESWPRDCAVAAAPPEPVASAPSIVPSSVAPPSISPSLAAPSSSAPPAPGSTSQPARPPSQGSTASDLTAQNALYAEATAARRRGDSGAAVDAYDRFVARHPTSALAESALVERMRLLAASDPRRGADAARAYLARYPRGFARAEAIELASRVP